MTKIHNTDVWPVLEFEAVRETLETLHQWLQIIGKIRLATMPWINHSWHASLYVSPHGYSTHGIPYRGRLFQIDFDFEAHQLILSLSHKKAKRIALEPMSVSEFYGQVMAALEHMGIEVEIHGSPNEMDPAVPFIENTGQAAYDKKAARTLWQAMLRSHIVFSRFRSSFIGKCSPVHLFWGAFDLAVTRFSGKPAPLHPGGVPNMPLDVMQEAYSREVSSAGFWPGSKDFPTPLFYAYAYPTPADFSIQPLQPGTAYYHEDLGEFVLAYEDVQKAPDPDQALYDFLESTYRAAAKTLSWDRDALEAPR